MSKPRSVFGVKAATRRLAFYHGLVGFTAVGALGYGAYDHKYYHAEFQAKIDRYFGAKSLRQKMVQKEKIEGEVDSLFEGLRLDCNKQYRTTGQPGSVLEHLKDLHVRDFEGAITAAVEKIREQKTKEADQQEDCVCQKLFKLWYSEKEATNSAYDRRNDIYE